MRLYLKVTKSDFVATFRNGPTNMWPLPEPDDKVAVEHLSHGAGKWAQEQGARDGQVQAVYKKLREAGYYIVGPRTGRGGRKQSVYADDIEI